MEGKAVVKKAARDLLTLVSGDQDEIRRLKRKVNVLIERLRVEREAKEEESHNAPLLRLEASRAEVARLMGELRSANEENCRLTNENVVLRHESQDKDDVIAKQSDKLFELQAEKNEIESVRAALWREQDARENDAKQITKRLRIEYVEQIASLKAQIASRDVELIAVRARNAETEIILRHVADQSGGGNRYAVFRLHRMTDAVLDLVSAALAADALQQNPKQEAKGPNV